MYFHIFLTLLVAKTVKPFAACDWNSYNTAENMFNSLANEMIQVDQTFQAVCNQFPQISAIEVFGEYSYRLEIYLPLFYTANFDIRIKHRAIYINAHYPRVAECDLTYVDIKVLPAFVDTYSAVWTYKDNKLIVALPYKQHLGDIDWGCGSVIDQSLKFVQNRSPSDSIFNEG